MKIEKKFKLRKIAGENIIVQQGQVGADLTKIISLNQSACFLYENLLNKEFTIKNVSELLVEEYHINQAQALDDATAWVEALKKCHVIID